MEGANPIDVFSVSIIRLEDAIAPSKVIETRKRVLLKELKQIFKQEDLDSLSDLVGQESVSYHLAKKAIHEMNSLEIADRKKLAKPLKDLLRLIKKVDPILDDVIELLDKQSSALNKINFFEFMKHIKQEVKVRNELRKSLRKQFSLISKGIELVVVVHDQEIISRSEPALKCDKKEPALTLILLLALGLNLIAYHYLTLKNASVKHASQPKTGVTRRQFIKTGLVAAGAMAVPAPVLAMASKAPTVPNGVIPTPITEFNVHRGNAVLSYEQIQLVAATCKDRSRYDYINYETLVENSFLLGQGHNQPYKEVRNYFSFRTHLLKLAEAQGYSLERLKTATIKEIVELSVRILNTQLDYQYAAYNEGCDDVNYDGVYDPVSSYALEHIGDNEIYKIKGKEVTGKELKMMIYKNPDEAKFYSKSVRFGTDRMYADEIFYSKLGICAHYAALLEHIFNIFISVSGIKNCVLMQTSGTLFPRGDHAWNILAALDETTGIVHYSPIDPTFADIERIDWDNLNALDIIHYGMDKCVALFKHLGRLDYFEADVLRLIKEHKTNYIKAYFYEELGRYHYEYTKNTNKMEEYMLKARKFGLKAKRRYVGKDNSIKCIRDNVDFINGILRSVEDHIIFGEKPIPKHLFRQGTSKQP